ncbi:MAG: prepilin-type N-terminal cleavage/methylation domain-containing protein [Candidatus Paceibacteria bacterium]
MIQNLIYKQQFLNVKFNKMNIRNEKQNKGFTLIETLVAIAILSVVIVAPIEFSRSSLLASFIARDQMVAHGLAQDAIETIRNVKDTNNQSIGNGWLRGLDPCFNSKTCRVDNLVGNTVNVINCSGSVCPPLQTVESGDVLLYGYNGVDSKFTREVNIRTVEIPARTILNEEGEDVIQVAANEAIVTVNVRWKPRPDMKERILTVQEHLFNWNE